MYFFVGINLILGLFNLMPVIPMDGGRAALAALSYYTDVRKAELIMRISTAVMGVLMAIGGVYILIKTRGNFTLLVTSIFVLGGLFGKRLYTAR